MSTFYEADWLINGGPPFEVTSCPQMDELVYAPDYDGVRIISDDMETWRVIKSVVDPQEPRSSEEHWIVCEGSPAEVLGYLTEYFDAVRKWYKENM